MKHQQLTHRTATASAVLLVVAVAAGIYLFQQRHRSPSGSDRAAISSATRFLDDWTDLDGRVVRRDQGGDTVSEGQAYGMLLAVVAHDRSRFDTIWKWTKVHMQQADGLLAWRWTNGRLADEQPAADADVDTAWALSRAAATFGGGTYLDDGKRIVQAILAKETVATPNGPVLVAGPWAKAAPATINPSYFVGGSATMLAALAGDSSWNASADATRELDRQLIGATTLPPDWATLPANSGPDSIRPASSPGGADGPRYGLDAPRLLIRLAASCAAGDREIAATAAPVIGGPTSTAIRSLSGQSQVDWQHPISDVATAAVESATGNQPAAASSLAAAAELQAKYPTYYGAAWVALGQAMLTTNVLGTCARTAA